MTTMYDDTESTNPQRLERLAASYNPDTAAEYDRIRRDVPADKISPTLRLAMGHSDAAHDASEQLNNTEK